MYSKQEEERLQIQLKNLTLVHDGTPLEPEETVLFFRRKFKSQPKPFRRYTDPSLTNTKTVEQKFNSALMGDLDRMLPTHSKTNARTKDLQKPFKKANLFVNVKKEKLKIFDANRGFS